jgi:hypothetical protein
MDTNMLNAMTQALDKAQEELDKAKYFEECGSNAGIRKMNENKAEWLRWVVYLAGYGLERMRADEKPVKATMSECVLCGKEFQKTIDDKDKLIDELQLTSEQLTARLKSLQFSFDHEVEYRNALIQKAYVDFIVKLSKYAHEYCWLDGTTLVCPVDNLDKRLLELAKE